MELAIGISYDYRKLLAPPVEIYLNPEHDPEASNSRFSSFFDFKKKVEQSACTEKAKRYFRRLSLNPAT
jgi:hypothetical protein